MGIFGKRISLNEVYFGRNKEIESLFNQFSKYRNKYIGNGYFVNMNCDKDAIKFNRMCEDVFGFYSFAFIIEPGAVYNAFTMPVSFKYDNKFDLSNTIVADRNGFKFKKNEKLCTSVFMYSSLFCDERITNEETFAVFLHEIGHNFSPAITKSGGIYGNAVKVLSILNILHEIIYIILHPISGIRNVMISFNSLNKVYNDLYKETNKRGLNNALFMFKSYVSFMMKIAMEITGVINVVLVLSNPITIVCNAILSKIQSLAPANLLLLVYGTEDENISDNFAAMYGFGNDLNTALKKMDEYYGGIKSQEVLTDIPVVGHLYNLYMIAFELVLYSFDEHPTNIARYNNNIKYIKYELNKENIDPKFKKELISQLKDMEDLVDDITHPKIEDTAYFKKIFGMIMLKLAGGDLKNIFNYHKKSLKDFDDSFERGSTNLPELDKVKIK